MLVSFIIEKLDAMGPIGVGYLIGNSELSHVRPCRNTKSISGDELRAWDLNMLDTDFALFVYSSSAAFALH